MPPNWPVEQSTVAIPLIGFNGQLLSRFSQHKYKVKFHQGEYKLKAHSDIPLHHFSKCYGKRRKSLCGSGSLIQAQQIRELVVEFLARRWLFPPPAAYLPELCRLRT